MAQSIYLEEYSTKSFVVRGDTRDHKDSLKAMGGKWNSRLTDKQSGEKFGAWLFWSDKRAEIDAWFGKGCPRQVSRVSPERVQQTFSSSRAPLAHGYSQSLEEKIDILTQMVTELCKKNNIDLPIVTVRKTDNVSLKTPQSVSDDEYIEDETPPKRLLVVKKKVVKK